MGACRGGMKRRHRAGFILGQRWPHAECGTRDPQPRRRQALTKLALTRGAPDADLATQPCS